MFPSTEGAFVGGHLGDVAQRLLNIRARESNQIIKGRVESHAAVQAVLGVLDERGREGGVHLLALDDAGVISDELLDHGRVPRFGMGAEVQLEPCEKCRKEVCAVEHGGK